MFRLHGPATVGIDGGVLAVLFHHRGVLMDDDFEVNESGAQREIERRDHATRGSWQLPRYPGYPLCWSQVDWCS